MKFYNNFIGRDTFIDAIRGVAIVFMLFENIFFLLITTDLKTPYYVIWLLIHPFAHLFFLLVGYCMFLSITKRRVFQEDSKIFIHIIKRGLTLFFLGFLITLFRFENVGDLNVIHLIGLSIIFTGLIAIPKNKNIYNIALLILLTNLFLTLKINVNLTTSNLSTFFDWLLNTGEFPFSNYLIYFIVGLGVSIYGFNKIWSIKKWIYASIFIVFSFFVSINYYPIDHHLNTPPTFFLNLLYLSVIIGTMKMAYSQDKFVNTFNFLALYGRYSLFIFFSHQFIFSFILGMLNLKNYFGVPIVTSFFLTYLVSIFFIIKILENQKNSN